MLYFDMSVEDFYIIDGANMINKQKVIKEYATKENDTGSSLVQVALLTARINDLSNHFQIHKKDFHSKRGLLKMVANRKKLLNYIKRTNLDKYRDLITKLKLRK
jgi:small subunit ribosomal protein S15